MPTFNKIRKNQPSNVQPKEEDAFVPPPTKEESYAPPPPPPDQPRRKQIKAAPLVTTNSYPQNGNHLIRIPPSPRKRATPKPAFGRFVPPTGGSKIFILFD